jgi:hypothetical protein
VVKSGRPIKIALLLSTRKIEIQHLRHGFGSKPISKTMSITENDSDTDSQTERDLLAEYPQGTAAKPIKTVREKRYSCHSWVGSCYEAEQAVFSCELEVDIRWLLQLVANSFTRS